MIAPDEAARLAVVLYEPEIPPNTGNVARTCAASGIPLHLIEPLGFSISDRQVKRAGLDYWNDVELSVHRDWEAFLQDCSPKAPALLTTKGTKSYTDIPPTDGEPRYLIFGPETRGLPDAVLARWPEHRYRVPMRSGRRSLNLGNTVAIVAYHMLARAGFPNMA